MDNYQNNISVDKLLNDGLILFGLGKFEEAIIYWKRALELSPNDSLAKEYLEIALEEIGQNPRDVGGGDVNQDPIAQALELLKQGELEKAHAILKLLLEISGENPQVHGYELLVKAHKLENYSKVMGELTAVPRVVKDFEGIKKLDLTKEAGFILSLVDGIATFDDILSMARLERLEAMGHLVSLIEKGVVRIGQ